MRFFILYVRSDHLSFNNVLVFNANAKILILYFLVKVSHKFITNLRFINITKVVIKM